MLFTLVKNELIKIFKRAKTWIVFALFALCLVGIIIVSNFDARDMRYNNSPEGRIESLNLQIKYTEDYIKQLEEDNASWSKEQIEQEKQNIEHFKREIEVQEELKKNANDPKAWRKELEEEKKNLQAVIDDPNTKEEFKRYEKTRIEEINEYLAKDMKPIAVWDFYPTNVGFRFIEVIGSIILAAGIAVFMSDIVSGESTPATLKFLLVQPISRGKVILSKFIAVVITVVGMIGGLELAAYGIMGAITGFDDAKMPNIIGLRYKFGYVNGKKELLPIEGSGIISTRGEALLQGFALQILFIIACCAFIFMISSLVKSSMISMAISVLISVATTMLFAIVRSLMAKFGHLVFFNYGNTINVVEGTIGFYNNNPNFTLGLGVSLMIGTIVVCYTIAYIVFKKKDILA